VTDFKIYSSITAPSEWCIECDSIQEILRCTFAEHTVSEILNFFRKELARVA
jgi:hypothetical protein